MIRICPRCGGCHFITQATVSQKWEVDAFGKKVRCIEGSLSHTDTIIRPAADCTRWTCTKCKYSGYGMLFQARYVAVFTEVKDGVLVSFPDFPNAFTEGRTMKEATDMAEDCLRLLVTDLIEDGETLPVKTPLYKILDQIDSEKQCASQIYI